MASARGAAGAALRTRGRGFAVLDARHDAVDGTHLLVARHLAHATVKHRVMKHQRQQALGVQHRCHGAVLLGDAAGHKVRCRVFCHAGLRPRATQTLHQLKQIGLHLARQRLCQQLCSGFVVALVSPCGPKLGRATHRAHAGILPIGRQQHLRHDKQVRCLALALVTHHLRHRLPHFHMRCLAFDHRQRNAVDKQHQVAADGVLAAAALHHKLRRHLKRVVQRVLPVDKAQRAATRIAVNRLLQRGAQRQQVVHRFVGAQQAVVGHALQALDGGTQVLFAEKVLARSGVDAVDALERITQHVIQHHIEQTRPAQLARLGRAQVLPAHGQQQLQGRGLAGHDLARVKVRVRRRAGGRSCGHDGAVWVE